MYFFKNRAKKRYTPAGSFKYVENLALYTQKDFKKGPILSFCKNIFL
jgi:hypothetical protein